MSGELVASDELAIRRCENAVREVARALAAASDMEIAPIALLPRMIQAFREEGMVVDASMLAGMPGLLG